MRGARIQTASQRGDVRASARIQPKNVVPEDGCGRGMSVTKKPTVSKIGTRRIDGKNELCFTYALYAIDLTEGSPLHVN